MQSFQLGFNPIYSEQAPSLEEINAIQGLAILEFGTPWCGHCQAAESAIKETLSVQNLPHIKVFDGQGKKLGRAFKVKLWPTLILLKNGEEVARIVRPTQVDHIKSLISSVSNKE